MGGASDAALGGGADGLNLRVLLERGTGGGGVQGKRHANDAAVWSSSVRMTSEGTWPAAAAVQCQRHSR